MTLICASRCKHGEPQSWERVGHKPLEIHCYDTLAGEPPERPAGRAPCQRKPGPVSSSDHPQVRCCGAAEHNAESVITGVRQKLDGRTLCLG